MHRAVLALVFMAGITLFVRHQFNAVMRAATATKSQSSFPTRPQGSAGSQESRRKCVMCGGSGRAVQWNFGAVNRPSVSHACPTCRGTGWVDNPRTW
jgi:DnaJ-class molecular chaperone